jgi:hypothetical protein
VPARQVIAVIHRSAKCRRLQQRRTGLTSVRQRGCHSRLTTMLSGIRAVMETNSSVSLPFASMCGFGVARKRNQRRTDRRPAGSCRRSRSSTAAQHVARRFGLTVMMRHRANTWRSGYLAHPNARRALRTVDSRKTHRPRRLAWLREIRWLGLPGSQCSHGQTRASALLSWQPTRPPALPPRGGPWPYFWSSEALPPCIVVGVCAPEWIRLNLDSNSTPFVR